MERIEGLSIELDLDSTRLDRGLKGAKSNLRSVNSEMKANMSAFDRGDRSVGKYETRLQGLNKKLDAQKRATSEALKEYEKMVDEHGEGSEQAEKAAREYNNQAAALNNLERYVGDATKELEEMRKEQEFQESSWGKMTSSLNDFSGKMNSLGDGFINTGRTLTKNVTAPMMAFGGIAVAAADKVEKAYRDIRVGTGATGDDLESLENSFDNVFANVPDDAEQVAGSLANLNTYTGATDDVLDGLSRTVLDVSRLLGEDAVSNSESFGKAMQQWQRPAEEGSDILDYLYTVTQDYGVGLGEISGQLSTYGAVLNNAGFEMEEAAHFMGSLEANGISVSRVMPGLNSAFRKWADEGKNSREELEKVITTIAETEDKQEALTIATETFGAEGAQRLMTAIRNGAIPAFEDLGAGAEDAKGSIQETTDETKTIGEEFAELKNQAVLELQPVGEIILDLAREKLPPLIDSVRDVVGWFDDLSPKAQDNAIKIAGIAAAAGPAAIGLGGIFKVTGSVAGGLASITETIGRKGGKGAAGAIGLLTKGGVVGLAVAGIGALSYGAYKLWEDFKEGKEVNLDLAQSFSDQASDLQDSADTFDRLSDKANISNAELAELNELNKRISESSNPGEIKELQQQYDTLAENSGLSKDELERLFSANENIIDQAPDVQTSISETGEEFVVATDKANEYAQTMRNMAENELRGERLDLIEQEQEALDIINEKTKERDELLDRQTTFHERANQYMEDHESAQQRINEIEDELGDKLQNRNELSGKEAEMAREYSDLTAIINDNVGDRNQNYENGLEPLNETIDANQAIIDKLAEAEMQMANIYLQNVGINEQGEQGLVKLDETINKNQKEIEQLQEKKSGGEQLTEEEQQRLTTLQESTTQQEAQRLKIFEELGLYNTINGLLESKYTQLTEEEQQLIRNKAATAEIEVENGNIVGQIQNKNKELSSSREELIKNLEQEGATTQEINNQVGELDNKIQRNDTVLQDILTEAGLWNDVKGEINLGADAIAGQGYGIDSNNDKTRTGIGLEQDRTAEAGRDVDKFVNAQDYGTVRGIDLAGMAGVIKPVTANDGGTVNDINIRASTRTEKLVNLTEGSSLSSLNQRIRRPVRKTVELVGKTVGSLGRAFGWAKGTPPQGHPGGDAIIGEKGRELVQLPNGSSFLSPGSDTFIPNMPKGTHVIPNHKTESILKGTSYYADGTDGWENLTNGASSRSSEFMTRLALFNRNQQQEVVVSGGRSIVSVEQKLDKLLDLLANMDTSQNNEYNQTLNFYNSEANPSENARKMKKALIDYGRKI